MLGPQEVVCHPQGSCLGQEDTAESSIKLIQLNREWNAERSWGGGLGTKNRSCHEQLNLLGTTGCSSELYLQHTVGRLCQS